MKKAELIEKIQRATLADQMADYAKPTLKLPMAEREVVRELFFERLRDLEFENLADRVYNYALRLTDDDTIWEEAYKFYCLYDSLFYLGEIGVPDAKERFEQLQELNRSIHSRNQMFKNLMSEYFPDMLARMER